MSNSSLIAILGPTGAGKSALAVTIAQAFGGEIVNFDSVQVYCGLDIGSAKTLPKDRHGLPHHLIDIVSPSADLTAGAFAMQARTCLRQIAACQALPVLVGGTGFYLSALLDGLSPAPGRNPDLRSRLTSLSLRRPAALHRFLTKADPSAAQRIHPNDHQKLIRAVELSKVQPPPPREPLTGFRILKIGLCPDRPQLYARINQRTAAMFQNGLLEETEALLASGVSPAAKAMQSLGYKQAVAVIEGRMALAEAILDAQTKTRQYAKRQLTWFRRINDVHWLPDFGDHIAVQRVALNQVNDWLRD